MFFFLLLLLFSFLLFLFFAFFFGASPERGLSRVGGVCPCGRFFSLSLFLLVRPAHV